MSCLFICACFQYDEGSWIFKVSPSREFFLYYIVVCVHIVVCIWCTYCSLCIGTLFSIPFSLLLVVAGLLGTSSMYLLSCVKRYYIIYIFVTIWKRYFNNFFIQGPPNKFFFFGKSFKKNYWIFLKFYFYLKVQFFRLIMENNFIQMAVSAGYAEAYMIGPIFKHIIVFHQ